MDFVTLCLFTGEHASLFGSLAREMFVTKPARGSEMDFDREVDGDNRERQRRAAIKHAGYVRPESRLAWERVQR